MRKRAAGALLSSRLAAQKDAKTVLAVSSPRDRPIRTLVTLKRGNAALWMWRKIERHQKASRAKIPNSADRHAQPSINSGSSGSARPVHQLRPGDRQLQSWILRRHGREEANHEQETWVFGRIDFLDIEYHGIGRPGKPGQSRRTTRHVSQHPCSLPQPHSFSPAYRPTADTEGAPPCT